MPISPQIPLTLFQNLMNYSPTFTTKPFSDYPSPHDRFSLFQKKWPAVCHYPKYVPRMAEGWTMAWPDEHFNQKSLKDRLSRVITEEGGKKYEFYNWGHCCNSSSWESSVFIRYTLRMGVSMSGSKKIVGLNGRNHTF